MTIDPGSGQPVGGGSPPEAAGPPAEAAFAQPEFGEPEAEQPQASDRLQSMLAQAVEGQRDDQREVAGVLGDMRNQLLRLGQEIAEMRASGGGEGVDASSVNNVTVELREAVRFLSERLDGVTRMVAQRGEELADTRAALTAIDAHVRSQAETIGMLSQGLQALPSYGERVSTLQDNIDRVHQRLGDVQAAVARPTDNSGLDQRLASIEGLVAPLSEHLAQSRQATADHSAALADHSAALAQQTDGISSNQASLAALHERVESLAAGTQAALAVPPTVDDSAIQAVDSRLSAVASDIAALRSELAGLAEAGNAAAPATSIDTTDFTLAVAQSEDRMRLHVDEAVMALAEMLLRRRPPSAPIDLSGTPLGDPLPPPVSEPVIPVVAPTALAPIEPEPVAVEPEAILEPEPVAVDEPIPALEYHDEDDEDGDDEEPAAEVAPPAVAPASELPEWWERDDPIAVPTPAVAASGPDQLDDEHPVVDFSAADFSDEGTAEADPEPDADTVDAAPAFDEDVVDAPPTEAVADDLDATSEMAPVAPIPVLPPEPPAVPPVAGTSWTPEVPAERPEVDASGTIVPERKRRWFTR